VSHHLDSPASRRDSRLNVTDLYVFNGETGTVLTMMTNTSLAGAARGDGFHPEGRYEFRVHPDLAAVERVVYRLAFSDPDAAGAQALTVHQLLGSEAAEDNAGGTLVAEGRTGDVIGGNGIRVWAGEAADPFYLDLTHLQHILEGLQHQDSIDIGGWTPAGAANSFAGSRVNAIVLEIPTSDAELRSGRPVGVWANTKLATDAGGWHQTNRTGIPMMWPIFRAIGGDDESPEYMHHTVGHPADDLGALCERVTDMVAAAVGPSGIADPAAYGRVVSERLLPDLLPYRVGTPAAFSFAGFNGRSLSDNAPEVMYGLITNSAIPTGLPAAIATETRQNGFPYVVPSA
jgi:hypothetical protein